MKGTEKKKNNTVSTTILICLVALVCVTLATLAWFSIADKTRLNGVNVDITTGKSLRFDLEEHDKFEDYTTTLNFEDIADYILLTKGIDIREKQINPVTTGDGRTFTYEKGTEADLEDYIEFDLHFMATTDMIVHLTSANGKDKDDGTKIMSENPDVPNAMRIGFDTPEGVMVYDPGMAGGKEVLKDMTLLGLSPADRIQYNEGTELFTIREGEDVPVTVRIWVEGTDEACTNDIKVADYAIKMRFVGTDENYQLFD